MHQNRHNLIATLLALTTMVALITVGIDRADALDAPLLNNPPERCTGYGNLQSMSLTDWESGLGAWSTGSYGIINPATFDTPDWAVAGNLPDSRPGNAAFVPNLDISECGPDDETGALTLTSPPIAIPGGTEVPRISIDHWFEIEPDWDGGNLRIKVGGSPFHLIPASAIEFAPYNGTLFPPLDEFGGIFNTNPLAGQEAFTGTYDDKPAGSWVQIRINLLGIAQAGDTIQLRFDFGVDDCGGAIGWYVDEVEFYSCEAELPPSNCGNGVINGNEQCDDGNDFIGDGCSNTCRIEEGWLCSSPTPPGTIKDPSFEDGRSNRFWDEVSNNGLGSPICDTATCNTGGGTGPSDGTYWVWLGGITPFQEGSVSQEIVIPSTVTELTFDLEISTCDSTLDYFEVLIDGNQELLVDGSDPRCGIVGYATQSVDISAYADGSTHDLEFHSITVSDNGSISNFFIDATAMPGSPSMCEREGTNLTLMKEVINDDGGSAYASAWTLTALGPTSFSDDGPVAFSGEDFLAGTYDLSESGGPAGYSASAWNCDGGSQVDGDTITVAQDEAVTCTITNNDIAPTLKVVKVIVNDNGGAVTDHNAFGLKIDGIPVLHNAVNVVEIGNHTVSEEGLPGYIAGTWGGDCNPDGTIALSLGQNAVCTITNNDITPTLTVLKTIINDNGGAITDPNAFGLKIDGAIVANNEANLVNAGFHALSETGLPGYVPGPWGGDCNPDGTITLALNQHATCTITNDDSDATSLTLVKQVINDNGGSAQGSAWTLAASGPSSFSGTGPKVSSGAGILPGNYDLSEIGGPAGYSAGNWACVGGSQVDGDTVFVAQGALVTCTMTNNDIAPTLTLVKTIVNDNGGNITDPDAFGLRIDGAAAQHNVPTVLNAGLHLAWENGLAGYLPGVWGGACDNDGYITLALDQHAICTISNDDIPPTLTVINIVNNNSGGTVTDPDEFGLRVDGNLVLHNASNTIDAGNHTVSQDGLPGYQAGAWFGDCNADGTINLVLGQIATCFVTNDDIAPTLTVVKTIINDAQGAITDPNAFGLKVDGTAVLHGVAYPLAPGSHTVSEDSLPGYIPSAWGGDCNPDGTISLEVGQEGICTITNDDDDTISLTLVKEVVNNNGGTAQASEWSLAANGPPSFSGPGPIVSSGESLAPGSYDLSESGGQAGYFARPWDCDGGTQIDNDTITLTAGESATCTIVNDDLTPTLTVVKTIVNDDGGTVTNPNAFGLKRNGLQAFHSQTVPVSVGEYLVSENGLPGYQPGTWGGDCNPDGSVSLALDQHAVCTITNDDIAPTLTVVKTIDNTMGGTVTDENAFGLKVDGAVVVHNVATEVAAGFHLVSEDGLPGYQAESWSGNCSADGSIVLALDQDATCTVNNVYTNTTSLVLVKSVINAHGGTALPDAWTLTATGPTTLSGNGPIVSSSAGFPSGVYDLSESGGPTTAGYSASNWVCVGGNQLDGDTISLAENDVATCTITNNDIPPTITVVKTVNNNNGGTVTDPDAFGLMIDGLAVLNNAINAVSAGVQHTVSEAGLPGYLPGDWGGDCNHDGTITLALDEHATCTITNDDIAPTLKVVKTVVNNNGGTVLDPDAFGLKVDGVTVLHDVANTFDAGNHTVSEDGLPGYQAGIWGGDCNSDGSITLALGQEATCTITNDDIAPTLTVLKTIVNNNGGTITDENAFGLRIDGSGVLHSVANILAAGAHTVSEDGLPEYVPGPWGGNCNPDGSITLALGQNATCTITNDDTDSTSLTLVKEVTNNNGGTAQPSAWTLTAAGPAGFSGKGPTVFNGANFSAGTYDLSESGGPDGYTTSDWVCVGGSQIDADTITLALGEEATCTISNDDITPTLTVVKSVVNNNGGTESDPNAFGLKVDGGAVLHNATNTFDAGNHTVSEDGSPGYEAGTWGGDCNPDGTITLALDQDALCTLTNDDSEPGLTLVNAVTNNNGGTAHPSEWTLTATGPSSFSGPGPTVSSASGFGIGTYDLSVSGGVSGYSASAWVCVGGTQSDADTVTLALGETATCTLTNDDITPTLTVVKGIVNNNGGTVVDPDAFGLRIDGVPVLHNAINEVDAGTRTLSEDGLPGYQAGAWSGDCNSDGTITLALDQHATCTLFNFDLQPSLTLVKEVINNNGGTAVPANWTLTATGPTGFSGPGPSVSNSAGFWSGSYDLSEIGGPDGYTTSDWVCIGGTQNDADTITLALGENATCTLTNDDIGPTLKVIKIITNDSGGTVTDSNAFGLKVDGNDVLSNATNSYNTGNHTVSEDGLPGYQLQGFGGDCNPDGTTTLALDQNATCILTNNDISPTLTVIKTVVNNNGGTITNPNDFGLKIDGQAVLNNAANTVDAGTRTVSEDGLPGYQAGAWGGDCNPDGTITLALDQDATCTLTNDDAEPGLTLVKKVINDNGGSAQPSAWTLTATGPAGFSGSGPSVSNGAGFLAGTYNLSESGGAPGYSSSAWTCIGGTQNDADTVTLALGETATCTLINNDISPTLTLVKTVVNDNGGTETDPDAFALRIDGNVVLHNAINAVNAGNHTLSEDGLPGYQAGTWGGDCNPDGTITLALDQDATCTLTNDDAEPGLTLIKEVINNNGGTAQPSAWTLTATGPAGFSGPGPSISNDEGFLAGTYDLAETGGVPGYSNSDWVCVGGTQDDAGTITLALGETATCTLTNDDIAPTLTVVKTIVNNNGGMVTDPNAFGLRIDGGVVVHNAINAVNAGGHSLSEDGLPGYQAGFWGGDCNPDGTITLALDQDATCTLTNDDISPTLTVVKTVINDNGGTISDPNAFGLKVDGGVVLNNATNNFDAGDHTVSENGQPGYEAGSWGGDCNPDGTITLALDQDATCTLTNDDAEPGLTLVKKVINDNGGSAQPSAWTLTATGPAGFSGQGPSVSNGEDFMIGTYDLSESGGPDGYASGDWVCVGGTQNDADTITLALGENATCTMTNDDITPTLTVLKTIINDNGGTVTDPDTFGLKVDGGVVLHNATNDFDAGNHTLSEEGLPGYEAGGWGGDCNPDGTITLALNQDATCTLTNDDIEPSLALVKNITNNNGGQAQPSDWTLTATGPASFSGPGPNVSNGADFQAGSYDLSESGGPDNYVPSAWVCLGGTQDDADTVTLAPGDTVTCTITNDDLGPGLTLIKEVINNHGGTAAPSAWTLNASGPTSFSGAGPNVSSGDDFEAGTYDLSENGGPNGYSASNWVCVGGSQDDEDTITLSLGEAAACTIRNDDDKPGLTLVKEVTNDNGGAAVPSDWTLIAAGPSGFSGAGPSVTSGDNFEAGSYDLSESSGPEGYVSGDWSCVGGTQDDADTITLTLGESATCTLSNDDAEPSLTLVKKVINNNGGDALTSDWSLAAAGPTGFSGAGPNVSNGGGFEAGSYDLSESNGPDGYKASDWNCIGGTQDDADTITLALGETATCTITNDDVGPGLTLVKKVVNNFTGPAVPSDWTLTADGPTGFSGAGPIVANEAGFEPGRYDLSESGDPEGYTASDWDCVGGTQNDADTITLALGEEATCTITNDDSGYNPVIYADGFESN